MSLPVKWLWRVILLLCLFSISRPHDAQAGLTLELISKSTTGLKSWHGGSNPSVSADGNTILFLSRDPFLVPPAVSCPPPANGPDSGCAHVYAYDRGSGSLTRVSVSTLGVDANQESADAAISATGRFVVFASDATNLVDDDTNGIRDVFIHDRATARTSRVSVAMDGKDANGASSRPSISADGRFVLFVSDASNLVEHDTNGARDVFLRDLVSNATQRVSAANSEAAAPASGDWPQMSDDARWIVMIQPGAGFVLFDRLAATRTVLTTAIPTEGRGFISANGRWITFGISSPDQWACQLVDRVSGSVVSAITSADPILCRRISDDGRTLPVIEVARVPWVAPAIDLGRRSLLVYDVHSGASIRVPGVSTGAIDAVLSSDGTVLAVQDEELWPLPEIRYRNQVYTAALDSDGDGLPTAWEEQFGLDSTSALGNAGSLGDSDHDGRTNVEEYSEGTHPHGLFRQYFAEGARGPFFSTQVALFNPNEMAAAAVQLHLSAQNGTMRRLAFLLPPLSRGTVTNTALGILGTAEFSMVVESNIPVVSDRTMTWDASRYGSHAETGVAGPATAWYFAEGATHSGFELFYLIQNPNTSAADIHVRYLMPSGAPIEKRYRVGANSRFTLWVDVDDPRLASTDLSTVITSDVPTVVERAMYLTTSQATFAAGHASAGVTEPATEWFLAEGATGPYFDEFILLGNATAMDAHAQVTYLLPDGSSVTKHYVIGANTRYTIWVDAEDDRLSDIAVSAAIVSLNGVPLLVERSMWWPGPTSATWAEAHNAAGLRTTGRKWAMAEGEVGGPWGVETYVLIANRGAADTARVTLYYEDGSSESKLVPLPAGSRTNVAVATDFPNSIGKRFGAIVEAVGPDAQIAVERAMYSNAGSVMWAAGTNAVATKLQ